MEATSPDVAFNHWRVRPRPEHTSLPVTSLPPTCRSDLTTSPLRSPATPIYDQGSGSLNQTVDQAPTLTVITSPSPGSSVMYGNEGQNSLNVTVSAPNVSGNSPSGSVNLYDGVPGPDTYLCTAFLGGSGAGQSSGNCYINNAADERRTLFADCNLRR